MSLPLRLYNSNTTLNLRLVEESKQGGATEIEPLTITPGTLLFSTYHVHLSSTTSVILDCPIIKKLVTLLLIFLTYLTRRDL
jgi:hypothetical protein